MATTSKKSNAEQELLKFHSYLRRFASFSAKIPWWVGMTLAAMSYLFFTFYFPQLSLAGPEDGALMRMLDDFVHRNAIVNLLNGFTTSTFMLMTAFSAVKEAKRSGALGGDDGTDEYFGMKSERFGSLVVESMEQDGFRVSRPAKRKSVVDLIAERGDVRLAVRFSDYQLYEIHEPEVEALVNAAKSEKASGAIYITVGGFGKRAVKYAEKHGVQLIGRKALLAFLKRAPASSEGATTGATPKPEGLSARPSAQFGDGVQHSGSSGPRRAKSSVLTPRPEGQFNPTFVLPQEVIAASNKSTDAE